MRETLLNFYGIQAVGFIKVTEYVYKVKAMDRFYALKFTATRNMDIAFEHIRSLHLKCFVDIIKNCNGSATTAFGNYYFYVMPWLENDQIIMKEIKLKTYLEYLSYIHNESFFQYNVSQNYFNQQMQDITKVIEEREQYYLSLMDNYEKMYQRTPSGWIFVLNYYRIREFLHRARMYLEKYNDYILDNDSVRLSVIYNNFNYQHILMGEQKLIAIDKMEINICIYDIYSMYQKVPELLFDLDGIATYYLNNVELLPEEKRLLSCLLCIVPYIEIEKD